jgi:hypothetical protein
MRSISIVLLFLAPVAASGADFGVRVILGLTDTAEAKWDGSVSARGAKITAMEPWRFSSEDAIVSGNAWQCSTRPIRLFGVRGERPVVANGVVLRLADANEETLLEIKTVQGDFSIRLSEIPFGKAVKKLDDRVLVDRIPHVEQLTDNREEQDYPAAASKNGELWLTWMEFSHSKEYSRIRADMHEAPANFEAWKALPGGDRIWARRYAGGRWGDAIAVTPGGEDLYRPAVAIDGQGRAWIFWSAQNNGNFDLWARPIENGQAGKVVRLSSEPGSDIDPAAATDSEGRVWVAWQGWRNGRASIFAAHQASNEFSDPLLVASSKGNEWNPAIASDSNGRVTVAWDSYRNGNYDIFLRTARSGTWGEEIAVAATARYEAYPSIAYEAGGRLWVAYEEGHERWGKDYGSAESSGVPLYAGRAVRLRAYEVNGQVVETKADAGTVLPASGSTKVDLPGRQSDRTDWYRPQPEAWKERNLHQPTRLQGGSRNSYPRLHVDPSGRLWMAVRNNHPIWWNPIGTVWSEYVVSYDGAHWTGPVFLSHSDNLLDNRPAVAATGNGELVVIGSSDWRREIYLHEKNPPRRGQAVEDPYNNDLFANHIRLAAGSGKLEVQAAAETKIAASPLDDALERASIERIRSARVLGKYKVLIGEFHRHSENSADGGGDGSLIDQWRYILDVADMNWAGCCDHDNGTHREYSWWVTQKLTDIFYAPGRFVPLFSYERSVSYPEGHRNVIFAQRGIHTLPRLPIQKDETENPAPDTQMLYRYLRRFNGVVAAHTSGTNMGTDWRDNDALVEPFVEIYQGIRQNYERPGAPRANSEKDSIGGWRPKGFINLALAKGHKLAFESSSDHVSTHMSYANALAEEATRESVLQAFQKRHVYAATDVILAEFTSGSQMMGDEFDTPSPPELKVKLAGTAPFARVHIIKDDEHVYTTEPGIRTVDFTWKDAAPARGKQSYYYVRGEQTDGEVVWASPMWITYTGN